MSDEYIPRNENYLKLSKATAGYVEIANFEKADTNVLFLQQSYLLSTATNARYLPAAESS
jgi:hypothetical protein